MASKTAKTRWKIRKAANGWEGSISFRLGDELAGHEITVGATGEDRQIALQRAAIAVDKIISNPIVAAALPPGTVVAVKAIKYLAGSKNVRDALSKYGGKGARRLARALGF